MKHRCYGMVFVALCLTACQAGVPSDTDTLAADENPTVTTTPAAAIENVPSQPTDASTVLASNGIESRISKDMAYADLRNAAMESGWKPVTNPECKKNVGGEARICEELPELESCSGDGYCLMKFSDSTGRHFNVTTYGMREDWNVSGTESRLNVVEWEFVK